MNYTQSRGNALSVVRWDVADKERSNRVIASRSLEVKMLKTNVKNLAVVASLIALNIVLSRFVSINAWNIKIGFTFISLYVAGYLYGPITAAIVGGLGDFIGASLFPIGPYFPGFTLTAVLTGLLFGLFLKDQNNFKVIIFTVLINEIVCSLVLNTYWIHLLYNADYKVLLISRLLQCGVMSIVEILTIKFLSKSMDIFKRRYLIK